MLCHLFQDFFSDLLSGYDEFVVEASSSSGSKATQQLKVDEAGLLAHHETISG